MVAVTVEMMVSGPLGELTGDPAKTLGIEGAVQRPVVGGPLADRARRSWSASSSASIASPRTSSRAGASACRAPSSGACLWIGAAVAFRLTADMRDWSGVASNDPSVTLIGQAVNAVVSTVLWAYLASIAILLGGEVNALLRARRAARAELARGDDQRMGSRPGGHGDLEPAVGAAGRGSHGPAV